MSNAQSISRLAYELWESRGCPENTAQADWLEAEQRLQTLPLTTTNSDTVDDALTDTFPASDPPASHLADVPPSNAAAKWVAADSAERGVDVR